MIADEAIIHAAVHAPWLQMRTPEDIGRELGVADLVESFKVGGQARGVMCGVRNSDDLAISLPHNANGTSGASGATTGGL